MKRNIHLQSAKEKKDDEFYTRYDEDLEASQNLAYLEYRYEEIINEIDWGSWNFTKRFYNTCKNK